MVTMRQFIFDQVLYEEHAPSVDTADVKMIGPIINRFGNADQRERFLGPWQRGELRWVTRSRIRHVHPSSSGR